jgi:hypothetical protein
LPVPLRVAGTVLVSAIRVAGTALVSAVRVAGARSGVCGGFWWRPL